MRRQWALVNMWDQPSIEYIPWTEFEIKQEVTCWSKSTVLYICWQLSIDKFNLLVKNIIDVIDNNTGTFFNWQRNYRTVNSSKVNLLNKNWKTKESIIHYQIECLNYLEKWLINLCWAPCNTTQTSLVFLPQVGMMRDSMGKVLTRM